MFLPIVVLADMLILLVFLTIVAASWKKANE